MNISKAEQRVLHVLALGGLIRHEFDDRGRLSDVTCFTRDGLVLADCDMALFQRLRRRRLIGSLGGAPYRITLKGRRAVRAQPDNQG
ncbi:hypothetical protein E7811_17125 [Aliigemmobacter aestuarii]|uniref:UPF0386 protein E7811_17125 n=1 Tax=Aliigemmobacter aestuarii TaxID=1445661 RepID=A0A4S3MIV2_9RHOB|nr:YjhX family toxin [Gemmobacter aestuarii]THD81190.1 hypothetical protein E7811_17125 [Gemmobacter aestuarii]